MLFCLLRLWEWGIELCLLMLPLARSVEATDAVMPDEVLPATLLPATPAVVLVLMVVAAVLLRALAFEEERW